MQLFLFWTKPLNVVWVDEMKIRAKWIVLVVCAVVGSWVIYQQMELDRGQKAFWRLGCANCHSAGGGPNLNFVKQKYDADTLVRFIQDPELVYKERGKKPLNSGYAAMHKVKTTPSEVRAIAAYLENIGN